MTARAELQVNKVWTQRWGCSWQQKYWSKTDDAGVCRALLTCPERRSSFDWTVRRLSIFLMISCRLERFNLMSTFYLTVNSRNQKQIHSSITRLLFSLFLLFDLVNKFLIFFYYYHFLLGFVAEFCVWDFEILKWRP